LHWARGFVEVRVRLGAWKRHEHATPGTRSVMSVGDDDVMVVIIMSMFVVVVVVVVVSSSAQYPCCCASNLCRSTYCVVVSDL
jgi:hypothetical protein